MLGQEPSEQDVKTMMEALPQPLTFSSFLTGMSSHLCDVSNREELLKAFEAFEQDVDNRKQNGIPIEDLQASLLEYGMGEQEIKAAMNSFIKPSSLFGDRFNYRDFVDMMRASDD